MTDGFWSPAAIRRLDLQHLVESEIYWRGSKRNLTSSAKMLCFASFYLLGVVPLIVI